METTRPTPTPSRSRRSRRLAATAVLAVAGLTLSACGGGSDEPEPTPSESPSESPTTSATATESDGLTAPGAQLAYGDTATVEYAAKGRKARLDLTVRSAERGALADFEEFDTQDPMVENANFYYVRVQVENAGKKPFGNAEVPLWGISGADTLLPPVKFTSAFETCPTEALPARFKPGDTFRTCLVFLSPKKGALEGVSYRPSVDDTPIEWRGPVTKPEKDKPKKKQKNGNGGNGGNDNGDN